MAKQEHTTLLKPPLKRGDENEVQSRCVPWMPADARLALIQALLALWGKGAADLFFQKDRELRAHVPCQACGWSHPRAPKTDEELPIVRGALDAQAVAESRARSFKFLLDQTREDLALARKGTSLADEWNRTDRQMATPPGCRWYSYTSEYGYDEHDTAKEATDEAQSEIDDATDGWPEDIERTEWGLLIPFESAEPYNRRPAPEGSEFDELVSYRLAPCEAQRFARAQAAEVARSKDPDIDALRRDSEELRDLLAILRTPPNVEHRDHLRRVVDHWLEAASDSPVRRCPCGLPLPDGSEGLCADCLAFASEPDEAGEDDE
jgi:hypothetical protein